jgi:hypothetical protein
MRPGRTTRLAAAALLGALAIAGCSSPDASIEDVLDASPDGTTVTTPPGDVTTAPTATPAEGGGGATEGGATGDGDQAAAPTAPPSPTTAALTPADDDASVGANARAMLRGDRPSLVLEIDVQQGVDVDRDAVDHLVSVLEGVLDKPGGIVVDGIEEFGDTRTTWSSDDLRAAAADHRTTATTDDQVSVHVLYVAGSHAQDGSQTNAIGVAYSASTIAIFPQRWQGMASLLGSSEAIERAVLVHELGHLLALVNLGYTSDIDHEDPEHPGHSANEDSAMYHAVETTLIGQVFSGPPPATFDEADRADLEGLRTGRL